METTARVFLVSGAINGLVSVVAGAFAAHGLKARLMPDMLAIFETGARYQMYHALAMVGIGLLASVRPSALLAVAGSAMLAGVVLFSGSLYALALSGVRALGMVTPIGGVAFVAGWALLAMAAIR